VTLQSLESASLVFVHAAELNGVPARVLFDTGATHSFIDSGFAAEQGFALSTPVDYNVTLGDGRSVLATGCTCAHVHCSSWCADQCCTDLHTPQLIF
jgi:hypothetical protein